MEPDSGGRFRLMRAPRRRVKDTGRAPTLRQCRVIAIVMLGTPDRAGDGPMTQTRSRFFDEMGRLMNDAAGVAQGVRREFDALFRTQAERILRDLEVVTRDEF